MSTMPVVTLTSDWNTSDYYIAAMHGYMLSHCPDIRVVDISHNISSFNSMQAAFVIRNCYKYFPAGTIHVICVNAEKNEQQPHVVVVHEHQYFIGTDNGQFSLIFDTPPQQIYAINISADLPATSFPELNVFAPTACSIVKSNKLNNIGKKATAINRQAPFIPVFEKDFISARIVYIDSHHNAITNVSQQLFDKVGNGRRFSIYVQSNRNRISRISTSYNENPSGELIALFNSCGLLEIAFTQGFAAQLFSLDHNTTIRINFYDN